MNNAKNQMKVIEGRCWNIHVMHNSNALSINAWLGFFSIFQNTWIFYLKYVNRERAPLELDELVQYRKLYDTLLTHSLFS